MRTGYGHMVHDDYVVRVRRIHEQRAARLSALRSPDDARAYQGEVRQAIAAAFGPWPERTPLNGHVTGALEREGYGIDKVVFESRPGFLVTANLYVPHDLSAPAPAAVVSCGHSDTGKAHPLYQHACQRLARAGFVVLIYDPINQGERDQYAMVPNRDSVSSCVQAHNMLGKQLELLGDWFGAWRMWDGIRALDYLLSRPEVDPKRVGVTGNSGGGTLSTWLWAAEPRFAMAAPSCFITTFLHNLENELPADCEQYPPGALAAGLEMADFLIARAPDPALILGQRHDYFDRRGHQEACDDVAAFYRLLGAPGRCRGFRGEHPHGFHDDVQREMVAFMCREAGQPVTFREEVESLAPEQLWATATGSVLAAGATPMPRLIAERAARQTASRERLAPDALRARLRALLGIVEGLPAPHHRNLRPTAIDGATCARYAVETQGPIRAILYKTMANPSLANSLDVEPIVHLYVPHLSSEEDLSADPLARDLRAAGPLYALDVRGLGETRPDEEGAFWQPYGMDYMHHGYALLMGESLLGRRVYDLLRTLDLLGAEGAREVHLYGRGQGAILALLAATLRPDGVASLTLRNAPASWRAWATAPLVAWPAANFLKGALANLDLEDCLASLRVPVTVVEPWGAPMSPA